MLSLWIRCEGSLTKVCPLSGIHVLALTGLVDLRHGRICDDTVFSVNVSIDAIVSGGGHGHGISVQKHAQNRQYRKWLTGTVVATRAGRPIYL